MKSLAFFATIVSIRAQQHGKGFPAVQCPNGYNLVGKKCEQTVQQTPMTVCAVGILNGNTCETVLPVGQQCPIGSVPNGKGCLAVHTNPAQSTCPPGFQDTGLACTTSKQLPLVETCDIGALDQSGQCTLIETAQKVIKTHCPPGYAQDGKGCAKATEYDCSPPHPIKATPPLVGPAPVLPFYGRGKKHRMLGAKKYSVYAPLPLPVPPPSKAQMLIPAPKVPPPPPAPTVAVARQTCIRKDFAPAITEASCPIGFVEQGKICEMRKTYGPTKRCANGLPASECIETVTAPRQFVCNQGILVGEECQFQLEVPVETVCPTGTHLSGGQCVQKTAPRLICPPGTVLQGQACLGKNYAEPTGIVTVACTGKGCFDH